MHIGTRCVSTLPDRWTISDLRTFLDHNGDYLYAGADLGLQEIGEDMRYVASLLEKIAENTPNARVTELEADVEKLQNEIIKNESEIDELNDKIETMKKEIDNLLQKNQSDR